VAAHLQRGRVLRLAGRFGDATQAYATAGEMANLSGDRRSEMVSRIGRAIVMQKTGDLPRSERELRTVLNEAQRLDDRFVEARAFHDLAMTAHLMQRPSEAVGLAFRAFTLYDEVAQRARALSDVGLFLKELGHYAAAREAFLHVLDIEPGAEIRINTTLELFELTALVQDRVGFERFHRELQSAYDHMPPDERVDYEMKLGAGLASFGATADAIGRLERALRLAEEYRLGQRVFEAERLLNETRAGRVAFESPPPPAEAWPASEPELRETIEELYALRSR
jgi:tetratricopeptide (TPR) repeat protein